MKAIGCEYDGKNSKVNFFNKSNSKFLNYKITNNKYFKENKNENKTKIS